MDSKPNSPFFFKKKEACFGFLILRPSSPHEYVGRESLNLQRDLASDQMKLFRCDRSMAIRPAGLLLIMRSLYNVGTCTSTTRAFR